MTPAIFPAAGGFGAGVIAGLVVPGAPWLLAPGAAAGAAAAWRRSRVWSVALASTSAGALWGAAASAGLRADCRSRWADGARMVVVAEPIERADGGARRLLRLVGPACAGATIRARVPWGDSATGVRVLVGTWQRDLFVDPRLPQRSERLGVLLVRQQRPVPWLPSWRSRLRLEAEARLARSFGERRSRLAAALTVTSEGGLQPSEREAWVRAGVAHLLSISGFHVAVIAASLIVLLRAARTPPTVAAVAATACAAAYVVYLGAPAPALRSALLLASWTWSRARQRPAVPTALLAGAAVCVLAADPLAALDPGAWLSFAGVWGVSSAARTWHRVVDQARERRTRSRLRLFAPLAVSAGATLATAPITIAVFGAASLSGVAANLAAVPLAAMAVPAIGLAMMLEGTVGGDAAAAAAGLALDGIELVVRIAASWPGGAPVFEARALPALVAAMAAAVVLRPIGSHGRRPASHVLRARLGLAAALIAGAACWPGLPQGATAADGRGVLTVHLLAVGQGDATAIRTPAGRWLLIDGGPRSGGVDAGRRKVVPFLRRHGARRLAVVVATHGDADHLGGLPAVLDVMPAELVLEPGQALASPLYRHWLARVARRSRRWHLARAGDTLEIDGVRLVVVHPDSAWMTRGHAPNENSVVLILEYGAFRAVFGGDAGRPMETERAGAVGDVTLLKVGHHGSRSATGEDWLAATRPEVCVIQVGRNRYGHPHPSVLAALDRAGCVTWRTDAHGDVRLTTDGRVARLRAAGTDTTFILGAGP